FLGIVGTHKNVARMHVGVEEAVSEDLGEKDLHATLGQFFHVCALGLERLHIGNGGAVDALHDQHFGAGVVPVDFRNIDQGGVLEITAQLRGVGGFPLQVQFVKNGLLIVGND